MRLRHFERDLTEDELKEIERRVNDVIAADMQVTEGFTNKLQTIG